MFELSFGKLLLIAVMALIVLGPERLPTVARTLGALVGRAQRFVASVKAEIQNEVGAAGLGSLRQDLHEAASAFQQRIEAEVHDANRSLAALSHEVHGVASQAQASVVEPGQSQVTATQLAALQAAHERAGLPPPALHEPDANYSLFADPAPAAAAPAPVNENQLDLFDDPPSGKPPSVPTHE